MNAYAHSPQLGRCRVISIERSRQTGCRSRRSISTKSTSCTTERLSLPNAPGIPSRSIGFSVPGNQLKFQRWQQSDNRRRRSPAALPDSAQTVLGHIATLQHSQSVADVSEGLETPVQLIYLLTLLGFLVVGAYLVVRQVLIRRELEEAAKVLGERIRTGSEDSEDLFQLGVILLRKKLFTQAVKHLEKAKKNWQGDPEELAQVHNALGFAFFNISKNELAIREYREAVNKQPGYVTALNNLGDAYEKAKNFPDALSTYQEALNYAPNNKVAASRVEELRGRV